MNSTIRNILAGEEISECYGQMYYSKNLETRRAELRKHYKFECQCIPCLENWPTIKVKFVLSTSLLTYCVGDAVC